MIIKIGVKTLSPQVVAYKELQEGDDEAAVFASLNAEVNSKGADPSDPTMIVFYDPKGSMNCRREVMVAINKEAPGLKIKKLPQITAGFIVYSDTKYQVEYYYAQLEQYLKERGLKTATNEINSIEAFYQPYQYDLGIGSYIDEDAQEIWVLEIIIPVEN